MEKTYNQLSEQEREKLSTLQEEGKTIGTLLQLWIARHQQFLEN